MQPYFHIALPPNSSTANSIRGSKGILFGKDREDLSQSSHGKTDHNSFPFTFLRSRSRDSDLPSLSSSGSPEAAWGYFTPTHSSVTVRRNIFMLPLPAIPLRPKLKVLPLQLCPERALFLSTESNLHASPSYLPELHYNLIPKAYLRFWFPPLPACLHFFPPKQFISNGYSLDYVNAKEVITYTGPGHLINHLD